MTEKAKKSSGSKKPERYKGPENIIEKDNWPIQLLRALTDFYDPDSRTYPKLKDWTDDQPPDWLKKMEDHFGRDSEEFAKIDRDARLKPGETRVTQKLRHVVGAVREFIDESLKYEREQLGLDFDCNRTAGYQ